MAPALELDLPQLASMRPMRVNFWLITVVPSSAIDPLSVTKNVRSCRSTRQYSAFSI